MRAHDLAGKNNGTGHVSVFQLQIASGTWEQLGWIVMGGDSSGSVLLSSDGNLDLSALRDRRAWISIRT
jgi:hypothetical protein